MNEIFLYAWTFFLFVNDNNGRHWDLFGFSTMNKKKKKRGGNDFERDEIIEKNINNDVSNDPSPKSVTRSTFDLKRSKRLNDSSIVYYYIILLLCHRYISSCWRHREWLLKTHHNSWFSFGPFGAYRTTQHSNEVIIIIGGRLERWSL